MIATLGGCKSSSLRTPAGKHPPRVANIRRHTVDLERWGLSSPIPFYSNFGYELGCCVAQIAGKPKIRQLGFLPVLGVCARISVSFLQRVWEFVCGLGYVGVTNWLESELLAGAPVRFWSLGQNIC